MNETKGAVVCWTKHKQKVSYTKLVLHGDDHVDVVETVQAEVFGEIAAQRDLLRIDLVAQSEHEEHSLLDHFARVRHMRVVLGE